MYELQGSDDEDEEWDEEVFSHSTPPHRPIWMRIVLIALILLVLLVLGIRLAFLADDIQWQQRQMKNYVNFTNTTRVATIQACRTDAPYRMSVMLILYGKNGRVVLSKTYLVDGAKWTLRSDVVTYPSWISSTPFAGLESGYKVTRLEGHYSDSATDRKYQHNDHDLNQGNDEIFTKHPWPVDQVRQLSVSWTPDGQTYDVFLAGSQLLLVPSSQQLAHCHP